MYLIKLDGIKDNKLLERFYSQISDLKLFRQVFIEYIPDLKEENPQLVNLLAHFVTLRAEELENVAEDALEDLVLDLIEAKKPTLLENSNLLSVEKAKLFQSISKSFGLEYRLVEQNDLGKEIDLANLTQSDLGVIYDIFAKEVPWYPFNINDFLIRWLIKPNGDVYDNAGKLALNLWEKPLIDLLLKKPSDLRFYQKIASKPEQNSTLNHNLYEPWVFLRPQKDINQRIFAYKKRIFEAIRNIEPSMYPNLSKDLYTLLNEAGYVKFDDITRIIEGNE